jgi:hypothetical protein
MKRRLVTTGRLKAVLVVSDEPELQMKQLLRELGLDAHLNLFTLCLECNQPLTSRSREQVRERVPPHVFKTQHHYMECPSCHRIYWRGSHWQAMTRKLKRLSRG